MTRNGKRDLVGKVVAITGGARGIGRASAEVFRAAGARVAIGDLDGELAAKEAADLGHPVIGMPLDVTDPDSFAAFLTAVEEAHGPLDVLVNNAGIMPTGPFLAEDEAMTDRIIAVNLRAVITGCRLAGDRFVARGEGVIVNVASLAGVFGAPAIATYSATKHAVIGLTESLDREFAGAGVRVVAVLPGVVRTELSAGANYPAWMNRIAAVEPADVARAVLAAVGARGTRKTVPGALGALVRAAALLPSGMRRGVERRVGLDTAYTRADTGAREHYHQRLRGDDS
jgi:NAD(P)-dependent dehydrogenase (short-subunit alcohol dehydrogenase family)